MRRSVPSATMSLLRSRRRRLRDLPIMPCWALAFERRILPLAVTRKRLAAARLVFIFDMNRLAASGLSHVSRDTWGRGPGLMTEVAPPVKSVCDGVGAILGAADPGTVGTELGSPTPGSCRRFRTLTRPLGWALVGGVGLRQVSAGGKAPLEAAWCGRRAARHFRQRLREGAIRAHACAKAHPQCRAATISARSCSSARGRS